MNRKVKQILRRFLASRSLCVNRERRPLAERPEAMLRPCFEHALCHALAESRLAGRSFCFVQVGAFDGVAKDPFHRYVEGNRLRGLLVEPQPEAFARLVENYRGSDGLAFENVAIDHVEGTRTLYRVRPGALGEHRWAYGIASFDRAMVFKHRSRLPGLDAAIEALTIRCVPLTPLIEKHGLERLDLLLVDAEGYDYQILLLADLARTRPALIRYEHVHLSPSDADAALRLLIDLGYKVAVEAMDTFAVREGVIESGHTA
jgi:FkbM family methyltransferase